MPDGYTCTIESSPTSATWTVGESDLSPESVTSSTVSPIDSTRVALTNETTMYASYASVRRFLTVHTAFGLPGSSETAISATARPRVRVRSVERADLPQRATKEGVPSRVRSFASISGQSDSISSTCSRLRSGRGSSSTTASDPASKAALVHIGASSSSPSPCTW